MTDAERNLIERACERLLIDYARYIDFRNYPGLIALFTGDGVLTVFGNEMRGPKVIREFLDARPANRKSMHLITNIWTNVIDADHAEGGSYITLFRADQDGDGPAKVPGPMLTGTYSTQYLRTAQGWRIATCNAAQMFNCYS